MKRRRKYGSTNHRIQSAMPMCYGSDAPYYYYEVEPNERSTRFKLGQETCIMDNEHFFIRGCIEIPVLDHFEPFIWDVWVSLSKENYQKMNNLWNVNGREEEPPYFGWLSTAIPCYPDTTTLKTLVYMRSVGVRPYIELEPTEHPLAIEQRKGITLSRVKGIYEEMSLFNRQNH
ncbi:DUF2199 domain-containing protein [Microbacteriaceae bacterium 4G12]